MRGFLPLALLLVGCGSASSSSSDIEGLGPNASLAPDFRVSAPRTGDGPMAITGILWAGEQAQSIPEGRLVVVANGARTPLARVKDTYSEDFSYTATFSSAVETDVSLVLVREADHVVGTAKLSAPFSFSLVAPPASVSTNDKLTLELSRALAADEVAWLVLRGQCLPPTLLDKPTLTGTRAEFVLDELAPFESCEATVDLQINRAGTIDPAFAHEIQLRSGPAPATFAATRLAAAQSKITVAAPK